MTTKAAKYSVRIYAGDQLIYRYSDSNFHRNDQMKSKLSCDARIPEQGKRNRYQDHISERKQRNL